MKRMIVWSLTLLLLGLLVGCSQPSTAPEAGRATDENVEQIEIVPIDVTYFTPSQQEGPYYTVDKPADRDNDLTVLDGAGGSPTGEILEFSGVVYDATGMPLEGIVLEIWQTDHNGAYLHPRDPATEGRDRNFQFYGEATTGADGRYEFRTIKPGKYEPRPVHIHVKVKAAGQELLTTQFYFEDANLSGNNANMEIAISNGSDAAGNPILTGERDVVLQVELPEYYP